MSKSVKMKIRCNSQRKVSIPLIVCSLRWCCTSIRQVHCRLLYLKGVYLKQKIEVQKHFFSTKRKTQRRNVRLEKPNKEQKMEMIENGKNNEQSEQNNSKAAVDCTPEKRWHTRFVVLHCLKFFLPCLSHLFHLTIFLFLW